MRKICNNCRSEQDIFSLGGKNYCVGCNNEINIDSGQISAQKQKSLHKMKTALDTFYNTLEPLEEYIEKAGYYSDFQSKRQRYRETIMDSEGPVENDEDLFLSNLYIFAQLTVKGKPDFFREIIRGDFYRWINYTGITADNCPETLKHFLIEINNVLDDKSEKIVAETEGKVVNVEINPKEMVGMFAGLHNSLSESGRQKKELEGRSWNELPEEYRLKGDADLGKQTFEEIERSVSISHENFRLRYFGEKRLEQGIRNPNYKPLIDDPEDEFLDSQDNAMDLDDNENKQSALEKNAETKISLSSRENEKLKDNSVDVVKVLGIIGLVSVATIASVALIRKKLSRKVKK